MKISIHIISFLLVLLVILGCSENKKKKQEATNWKFSKEIPLGNISPIGIVAQGNFLWLSDVANNRIVKIDLDGTMIESFDGFQRPMHIAIQEDKIYVPEYTSDTVKIIENGTVSTFALKENTDAIAGIAIDGNTFAVTDFYNHRIIFQQDDKVTIIGKEGHNDGELYYPTDVDINNDLIYVADAYNNRVQVFDLKGKFLNDIGNQDRVNVASAVSVNGSYIAIADQENSRVLIYNIDGFLLQILEENINYPTEVLLDKENLYIANFKENTLSVYIIMEI
tara:strand:+ start:1052 stop:1891 length:840 start_codon:yes stop_codon:yes gene_type:complete